MRRALEQAALDAISAHPAVKPPLPELTRAVATGEIPPENATGGLVALFLAGR